MSESPLMIEDLPYPVSFNVKELQRPEYSQGFIKSDDTFLTL